MPPHDTTPFDSTQFWADYTPRPGPQQVGTLRQQLAAVDVLYWDHLSWIDPDAAWQAARITAIPHADPAYLETYLFTDDNNDLPRRRDG